MTHPFISADISIFPQETCNFCNIKKCSYRLHFNTRFLNLLALFESLKVVLIKMASMLMISAKMAALDLLKIKVFSNKGYDVIVSEHDVTKKGLSRVQITLWIWSCDQSLVTLRFL